MIVGIDDDGAGQFLAVIVDDGAAERRCRRRGGIARLGELGLVVRLEGGFRGGLIGGSRHAAGQRKADGEQPQDYFKRRHGTVPIDNLAFRSNKCCTKNATIPLIPLSAKRREYASVCTLASRCGSAAVAFMPQILRPLVVFRAGGAQGPNLGHAGATARPQMW